MHENSVFAGGFMFEGWTKPKNVELPWELRALRNSGERVLHLLPGCQEVRIVQAVDLNQSAFHVVRVRGGQPGLSVAGRKDALEAEGTIPHALGRFVHVSAPAPPRPAGQLLGARAPDVRTDMIATPMLFRFTASGPTPEAAFAAFATKDGEELHDPFWPRADLSRVTEVTVAADRDRLRADGCFDGAAGGPLCEDDADWFADRLIEEYDPIVRSGAAARL
ncbi:hypothetical protein ACFWB1_20400 [Streptomyces goshikiensis]|uniref:hypothetical protein n=1 Tax=Streptomyces goshikiensis TaxID=1942 RepID=UPI00368BC8A7